MTAGLFNLYYSFCFDWNRLLLTMPELPFDIPQSLASYVSHFDDDPVTATERLKKQLNKRGPDAVGYFLLAWFYHLQDMNEKAVEESLKAKTLAPGSPFFEKLHYYLSHPHTFDAWTPSEYSEPDGNTEFETRHTPVLEDLDSLIEKLSEVEAEKITFSFSDKKSSDPKNKKPIDDVADIVSETLAGIHEKQGKTEAAIRTYERLKELRKEKSDYYAEQITRLRKVQEE